MEQKLAAGLISPAEWEIMRVIWTLGPTKTNIIVKIMQNKKSWKVSTIKTLLARLTRKGYLNPQKIGREFCYHAEIKENEAIDQTIKEFFNDICAMKAGKAINYLIQNVTLSKSDLKTLNQTINQRFDGAPESIPCNCVPKQYRKMANFCVSEVSTVKKNREN